MQMPKGLIQDSDFKPLTIADRDTLANFVNRCEYPLCEYSVSTQICWQGYNQSQWMVLDEKWLLIRYVSDGAMCFLCPIGTGDIRPVVDACFEHLVAKGVRPRLTFVPTPVRETLGDAAFQWTADSGERDYLYRRDDLALLIGRRYSRKRNHIKKFQHTYDWRFETFLPAHQGEWAAFVEAWCAQNDCSQQPVLAYEVAAMLRWIDWHDRLPMHAHALRVDGQVVGVSVGETLTPDTFVVHYEKAFRQYDGIYPMLTWLAAREVPRSCMWINREQDMNEPGLRTSKESFFPDRMEIAYTAVPL